MTRPSEYSAIGDVVKLLADDGFDALGDSHPQNHQRGHAP